MKRITQRSTALAITLMLAFATLAMSAPKAEAASKYLSIYGRVLDIDQSNRTLLVKDYWSKKIYLVKVPEGETFRITFGMKQKTAQPGFEDVRKNDRVQMRCIRSSEHLARLDDGREVVVLTSATY